MGKKKTEESVIFSVSLPRKYVEALDNFASSMDMPRSKVVRRALICLWKDVDAVEAMVEMFGADPVKVRRTYRKLGLEAPEDSAPPSRFLGKKTSASSRRTVPRGKTVKA